MTATIATNTRLTWAACSVIDQLRTLIGDLKIILRQLNLHSKELISVDERHIALAVAVESRLSIIDCSL
jgi:hypothetical protein